MWDDIFHNVKWSQSEFGEHLLCLCANVSVNVCVYECAIKICLLSKFQYNTINSKSMIFSFDSGWLNLTNFQVCNKALVMHIQLTVCFQFLFLFPGLVICSNTQLCNRQQKRSEAPSHLSTILTNTLHFAHCSAVILLRQDIFIMFVCFQSAMGLLRLNLLYKE